MYSMSTSPPNIEIFIAETMKSFLALVIETPSEMIEFLFGSQIGIQNLQFVDAVRSPIFTNEILFMMQFCYTFQRNFASCKKQSQLQSDVHVTAPIIIRKKRTCRFKEVSKLSLCPHNKYFVSK